MTQPILTLMAYRGANILGVGIGALCAAAAVMFTRTVKPFGDPEDMGRPLWRRGLEVLTIVPIASPMPYLISLVAFRNFPTVELNGIASNFRWSGSITSTLLSLFYGYQLIRDQVGC